MQESQLGFGQAPSASNLHSTSGATKRNRGEDEESEREAPRRKRGNADFDDPEAEGFDESEVEIEATNGDDGPGAAQDEQGTSGEADNEELVTRSVAKAVRKANRKEKVKEAKEHRETRRKVWLQVLRSDRLAALAPRLPQEAVPEWIAEVEATHSRVYERGGFFICAACGSFASRKPQALRQPCKGHISYTAPLVNLVKRAAPPPGYKRWACTTAAEQADEGRPPKLRLVVRSGVATAAEGNCTADVSRALSYMRGRKRKHEEVAIEEARGDTPSSSAAEDPATVEAERGGCQPRPEATEAPPTTIIY